MSLLSLGEQGRRNAEYRRGTIMGLTVAEVFILLAFILLLLVALWRAVEERRCKEIIDKVSSTELTKYVDIKDLDTIIKISKDGQLHEAINTIKMIQSGARLVDKGELKDLIDKIEGLPRTQQKEFTDLLSVDGYQKIIEWAHRLATLVKDGRDPSEMDKALDLVSVIPPEDLKDVESLKRRIRQRIQSGEALGHEVALAVGRAVGGLVSKIGGEIDQETGAVTLPDTALFAQGSASLSDPTKHFLDQFCHPWLDTLSQFDAQIGALRIEGHASTEWGQSTGQEDAFLKNMDLSQRRASAVLEYCLRNLAKFDYRHWAESRLVAVGFSSAKPVLVEGIEDPTRSRRVVFRSEIDKNKIIKDIEKDLVTVSEHK